LIAGNQGEDIAMYGDHMMMMPFVPLLLISIPFAVGNAFLARRLGKSVALWVVLSLIPGVNFLFFYYVAYIVIYSMLDRLRAIGDDVRRVGAAP
jgi:hypothetical protein